MSWRVTSSCAGGGGGGGVHAAVRHFALQLYPVVVLTTHDPGHSFVATHCRQFVLFQGAGPCGQDFSVSISQSVWFPGGGGGGASAEHSTFQLPWLNVSIQPPTSTQSVLFPGGTVM